MAGTKASAKRGPGQPSKYSPALAERICTLIGTGSALTEICEQDWCPCYSTVGKWRREIPEFSAMYARAREDLADHEADEIKAIADAQPPAIFETNEDGEAIAAKLDSAYVAWQRNRIDVRKWRAAKMRPRVYADRQEHTLETGLNLTAVLRELARRRA